MAFAKLERGLELTEKSPKIMWYRMAYWLIIFNLTASVNNFYLLEVVGRHSETQFQVGKNINSLR